MIKAIISFLFISHVNSLQFRYLNGAQRMSKTNPVSKLSMSTGNVLLPEPFPGSPVVKSINKETNVAYMKVALSGAQTQKAFNEACDIFNAEVKKKELKVPGFRPGAKLPPAYLYQIFGEEQIKGICANLLSEEIQDECERTGLMFVGRGRITNFNEPAFVAGQTHALEIECDLWPAISYGDAGGYKALKFTVMKGKRDTEKYEQVKASIRDRYKQLEDTPEGYGAQLGDVVVANMKGYEKSSSGGKGAPLPAIATGDSLEIILEAGKFMEGLIEGLVGAKAGEMKT
eukprot:gene12756-26867_t